MINKHPIRLDWIPCPGGWFRPWFVCPRCGRRCALLYLSSLPACRHRYGLVYPSRRKPADDRAIRRAERIRARLGWKPDIANPGSGKPKFMHWRTYERLKAEHAAFADAALAGMARRLV